MSGAWVYAIPMILIGACVGYWVHINTKKNKSE